MIEIEIEAVPDGKINGKSPAQWHKHWDDELQAAKKRLRKFHNQGAKVVERFLDERLQAEGRHSRLNLFHKNVSTVMSMMYGQTPKINVGREFSDPDDDLARVSSVILERMLTTDQDKFGACLRSVLEDVLLPGLGVARVRYEYESTITTEVGLDGVEAEVEKITAEHTPVDYIHWQDLAWGWGRTWDEVPWWGFRSYLSKCEVKERFGDDIANNLEYKKQSADPNNDTSDNKSNVQKAEIWEFWKKDCKKVYWYSEGAELILDIQDDPLGLTDFFPMPRPIMTNTTTSLYVPRADFVFSQDLYNEIDELQSRISVITNAIKVVGVYDQKAGGSVGRMLQEGRENDLIPVENWAMFAEKGALKGVIDWFPVETVVGVLQTLQAVQQTKIEQLYEMTGLSDIMRGANTDQYTGASTQQLKAKMGSIQIQALQEEFARFASDLEKIKAEIIVKHFAPEQILRQSNAGFLPEPDRQYISQALQLLKSPDIKWRIAIKPESIAMVDYAQIRQERSEFLMAMSQYIQSAQAAAREIPGSLPILLELMKWGMQGFKGADYLEGSFDKAIDMARQGAMNPQQDQGPSPEEIKAQTEQMKIQAQQAKSQAELQKIQAKSQADMQLLQAKIQGEIQKIQVDAQRDQQLEDMQSQYALLEIAKELEAKITELETAFQTNAELERVQATEDMRLNNQQHLHRVSEIQLQQRGTGYES